jgi:alkanesulfonate monooxygenase SsuD/methylene tetrahydromethanopterin reductase-like flavin-dependent oxidoreductase (luciferase family)
VLGIGLSSRVIVGDWHGLAFAPSIQQIREAVQIIRMVAAGERVSFEGKFYRVKNFRLAAPPPAWEGGEAARHLAAVTAEDKVDAHERSRPIAQL